MIASEIKENGSRRRLSIQVYLILMNLILLFLLFPSAGYLFIKESSRFRDVQLERAISQRHRALESRSATLARNISLSASEAVAGYDFSLLTAMTKQMVENDDEILYALIIDRNQRVVVQVGLEGLAELLPMRDQDIEDLLSREFTSNITQDQPVPVHFHRSEAILEVIVPVYSGGDLWGLMRCGHSLKELHLEIADLQDEWADKMRKFKVYLYSSMAIFICLGVIVALVITRFIVNSIDELNVGVKRVAKGDLDHEIRPQDMVCDEFVSLARAFNSMTGKLRDSYSKLEEYSRSLEDKVAERTKALEEAQASLVKQAHEAGMAEMAVGVLHNIGNAITPAKVALALLLKRLETTPIRVGLSETMEKVAAIIKNDQGLSEAEKDRLSQIVTLIPESIKEECNHTIDEIRKIQNKQDHVEGIINLQMRYARLVGNFESVNLNRLVSDALKMLDDGLGRREVTVETDLGELPPIRFEETKLLQILINLIKNGYEAMEQTPPELRHLSISTSYEKGDPGSVVLRIKDNGLGFDPGEKEKIFTCGYTTKKSGSGFGLHSCANYVIANQGTLEAVSEGPGKGAEFVIRFPVDVENRKQSDDEVKTRQ